MKLLHLSLAVLLMGACVFAEEEEEGEKKQEKESPVGTVIGIDLGTTYSW